MRTNFYIESNVLALLLLAFQTVPAVPDDGKLRVCIVESRGIYRKTPKFCPILEATSNIECVVGVDRLDCVRRIHKGTAHFGVLSSEDLVAARWASVEILVASELRSHSTPFEYEMVVIVDNQAEIHTVHDLRGAKLCHPGYGLANHWTEMLSNYFESTLVSRSCDPDITVTEDRIRATAKYFGPSCKAGPWVPDLKQDRMLKERYFSLCQMCYDPYRCDIGDKHWGRRGALYCVTNGGGNVAWARLDDVRSHFGFTGVPAQADSNEFSFLCPDGHQQPINSSAPCIWVAKPWPVIAARRTHAAQIQRLVTGLTHDDPQSWQNALLSLLETYHISIEPLDNVIPIDDYLDQAIAFQGAYSFPECNPPRSIVYCTTSIIEHIKCSWLQEAAQVYGVQPNIQCIRAMELDACMDDIKYGAADAMLVDQDARIKAQRDHGLVPLLYEFAPDMHERYVTIALVRKDTSWHRFEELHGLRACLPSYEGAAHLSVLGTIANITQHVTTLQAFFHRDSCLWQPNAIHKCAAKYRGDEGALRCLADGVGDVAFLSSDLYKRYAIGNLSATWIHQSHQQPSFRLLCPYGAASRFEYCYLHWTTRGHIMTHNSSSIARRNEIYNSLRDMDRLFGKNYKTETRPFAMYGVFDQRSNVMFRDNTQELRDLSELRKDSAQRLIEPIFDSYVNRYYDSPEPFSSTVTSEVSKYMMLLGLSVTSFLYRIPF